MSVLLSKHYSQRRIAEESRRISEIQREDFIAALAHDLKIPVLGATRIMELMLNGAVGSLTTEQSKLIEQMKLSNEAQLRMIKKLLEVYRTQTSDQPITLELLDLALNAERCVAEFQPLASARGISLEKELTDSKVVVSGDSEGVQSLLRNLLDNAIKFTSRGGTILVALYVRGSSVFISVTDSGQGIAEESKPYLFDRFWHGGPGRYSAGVGLGLYLCKRIVDRLGGSISCSSELGKGTCFTVQLPLAQESAPSLEAGKV